ncbi:MAG: hypothetical protein A3G32_07025 [Deltaproteobacteria bacterium RIFCSPLOWO2_12_FULL_40_28]|nr:MAG: hypothetical protein A3C45_07070 [Deltaproteobacteria bacterium RIFCSPHIGHO2_02_FULL_40_28]OGQ19291.1 MAG: hypothetical protein A3E27_04745 [Deltaproteobacteria bacterium RIFCSPHIGHO2_12_FULL_40_32]OGQ40485.1 MAG: hypothetical protein A3I69_00325 [Deltaproteobacteria bacterium RIFCSPLOWO2_02_FULL_40_36]OGQ53721.1 MAG: hypothetical protein A3G32_07025 [Deltaproteobacteria bacterium RIFCSPLOWO2_12_FULL_40_28]
MDLKIEMIAPHEIGGPLYKIKKSELTKNLFQSIETLGILVPLIGVKKDGKIFIVDGYCRLQAALKLQLSLVPLFFISDTEQGLLKKYLELHHAGKKSHPIEVLNLMLLMKEMSLSYKECNDFLATMGVFGVEAQNYLRFSQDEIEKLIVFLDSLHLNQNKVFEILDYLHDIGKRDHIFLEDLIKIIPAYSGEQKGESVRQFLKGKRYPQFLLKEKEFLKNLSLLPANKNLTIRLPDHFESGTLELKAQLSHPDDLLKLKELLSHSQWTHLFEIVK